MPTIPTLGFNSFNARFAPTEQFPYFYADDPTYAGMEAGSRVQALKNLAAMMSAGQGGQNATVLGGQGASMAPPLTGPQQSYANASTLNGSGDGQSGQALRQASNYNNSPYTAPQGTIGNTGQPVGPPQAGSQGELTGQGGQGWNIYQTTPTWTGSPLSQSPPARDEGEFNAPSLTGPQNPLLQRQAQIRQLILQQAMQNIPRGYRFKLG